MTSRVALSRRLAGSSWGAGATTLRIATLALVHSTAEYCAPVWHRSAHTRLIGPAINDALRIVTGCLRPTPVDNLPILANIQPAELRRNGATHSLARRACSAQPSSVRRARMHAISNRDTHLYTLHNNSSVHLTTTTTYVRRTGQITNGMRSGWTTLRDFVLSSPTPAPTLPERPSQEQRGSDLTASAQVSNVSTPVCTNGAWPPLRPVSVAQKNKPSTLSSSSVQPIDLLVDCTA